MFYYRQSYFNVAMGPLTYLPLSNLQDETQRLLCGSWHYANNSGTKYLPSFWGFLGTFVDYLSFSMQFKRCMRTLA